MKLYVKWKGDLFNRQNDKKRYNIKRVIIQNQKDILEKKIKTLLNLSDYATKYYIERATGIDTSLLSKKVDLVGLKSKADKLDVDKLETILPDLSNLSNLVDNNVVKKIVYNELVTKINAIDTSKLDSKTQYISEKKFFGKDIEDVEKKYLVLMGQLLLLLLIEKLLTQKYVK